jgi:hypothetical protein
LVEVGTVILDDLEVDSVAVASDELDVAAVMGAGDG